MGKEVKGFMAERWTLSLFAGLAERFGTRILREKWTEDELPAGELKARLALAYPEHKEVISISFVACNQAYVHDETLVRSEDELALLPPVSGGSGESDPEADSRGVPMYAIVEEPIDALAVLASVFHPDHGAALAFAGTTREWTNGQRTLTLEYEAYVPMAVAAMRRIGEEISTKWPGTLTAITHRIGSVGIGEISVLIAVSSARRAEAYEASRYAIERLKQTVPVWKKEVYEDGTEWKGHQLGPWNPMDPHE
jgi:molybdopterin synthase catalytic subunit/molybdopterin converting factor small subunit